MNYSKDAHDKGENSAMSENPEKPRKGTKAAI
jgi:hypothetical protein